VTGTLWTLGGTGGEAVSVLVLAYEQEALTNYYDSNWLRVEVGLRMGRLSVRYPASFLAPELARFERELSELVAAASDSATFVSLDGQLALELAADGLGQVAVKWAASPRTSAEPWEIRGNFTTDHASVRHTLAEVQRVSAQFPERGQELER